MVSKLLTVSVYGSGAELTTVEATTSRGLPGISIVGLGNKTIEEAKERVRSAVVNSGLKIPAQRFTINLSPAEQHKEGASLDLAIALSILAASKQLEVKEELAWAFVGELSLDGGVMPVRGIIPILQCLKARGVTKVMLPQANIQLASLISGISLYGVTSLRQAYLHLTDVTQLPAIKPSSVFDTKQSSPRPLSSLNEVKGHALAKRSLVIAATGRHNLLLHGPPGTGKSMLAKALPELLPSLTEEEFFGVNSVRSLVGKDKLSFSRPFISPHHTATQAALVGGGSSPRPGLISQSHHGVLFLDEIAEFPKNCIEILRQPLEESEVSIARARGTLTFPANFLLVVAHNPCPCGYLGDPKISCSCSPYQIERYRSKLSGPILDRIDLHVNVPRQPAKSLLDRSKQPQFDTETQIKQMLVCANKKQSYRNQGKPNAKLSRRELLSLTSLSDDAEQLLLSAARKLNLSARVIIKTLSVALTISDLEPGSLSKKSALTVKHIAEALTYRPKPLNM